MFITRALINFCQFIRGEWKVFAAMTIGVIISAIAVAYFTIPYKFPDLGVSGLAVLANYAFGISPAWIIFFGNLLLFIWGWKSLSPRFICLSSYYVILFTVLLPFFSAIEIDLPEDRFLVAVISGVLKGVSGALVLHAGGSSGGTDIIAVALRKRYGVEIGSFSVAINLVILGLSLGVVGLHSTIYGIVALYVFGVVVDNTSHSFDKRKQAFIITNIPKEVSSYITHTFNRGATLLRGEGGFTGQERPLVMTLLDKKQVALLKDYLRSNDPKAFVSICDAAEVLGEGFKSWKSL
ncbi:MAG: YitT family protein [Synergistaceae bacterium]|nr:YitT family protein [Synergistaceae bacterium]